MLPAGARLGPYQIVSLLGVGGMGEVYRARDVRLERDVAVKVLPELFVADPDRIARFQREARTLALLNHPHIGAILGLEDAGDVQAIIMELVEGPTLADRISSGPIPLDEALPIARQIADALEAAHEQGIVHRDLKPTNIKLRDDGTVKVLDFGLAKAVESNDSSSPMSVSPTLSVRATQAGVILGTAAYMSPEQARGRAVNKRTDVWAFGCVLFEMLSGARAFDGEDIAETIGAVIHKPPAWDRLPATTPSTVRTTLDRCLQKDLKERVRDIGDVQLALRGGFETPMRPATEGQPIPQTRSQWKRLVAPLAAAALGCVTAGAAVWMLKPPASVQEPVGRFSILLGEGQQFSGMYENLAISADGHRLVYTANNQFYSRSMSDFEARPIPGTAATLSPGYPAFSPNGEFVAFFSPKDRAIKKIAIGGGTAVTLCPGEVPFLGLSWDATGIVFADARGVMRVSANGGSAERLIEATGQERIYGPRLLPGGEWVLFTAAGAGTRLAEAADWDKAQIVAQSLRSSERKTVVTAGTDGRYVEGGHLVYVQAGVLFAVPFDAAHIAVTGGPVPIVEGVKRSLASAHFSISTTGTLVFVPGPVAVSATQGLAVIDRTGTIQQLKVAAGAYEYPRVSRDGKRVALGTNDGKDAVIWIYELSESTAIRRLTVGGRNRVPVWSPDGQYVAFQSDREGDLAVFRQRADGAGAAERLTRPEQDTSHVPQSWSADGKVLLVESIKDRSHSLAVLELADRRLTPFPGVVSEITPGAVFSPNGAWVAYAVGERRTSNVFVQPFPPTGAVYPISKDGGVQPGWSFDGKELFYDPSITTSVVVSVTTRPSFSFGNPVAVPRVFVERGAGFQRNYDAMADGRLVAVVDATEAAAPQATQVRVVMNWQEELKQRVRPLK